jgi:glycosyltransferase involved in cell wall biosynthesis
MPHICVVAGCYNEEGNVAELHERVVKVFETELPGYTFDLLLIDNASEDRTVEVLREIARRDKRLKVIVNNRNFGPTRSGYHALLAARGDAIVAMASDLEDPPELIPQFVRKWEEGYKLVLAQKTGTDEGFVFSLVRKAYYRLLAVVSETKLVKDATGFGLYDRKVMEDVRRIGDPYPYMRGMLCEIGDAYCLIPFHKPVRKRGISKNNFYSLYDTAMLGITNHSKVPLRLAAFTGFCLGACSFVVAFAYLIYKLMFWNSFRLGTAPVVIGIFFFSAVQLIFIGILGEYIGAIYTQVQNRPTVFEKERINFD